GWMLERHGWGQLLGWLSAFGVWGLFLLRLGPFEAAIRWMRSPWLVFSLTPFVDGWKRLVLDAMVALLIGLGGKGESPPQGVKRHPLEKGIP
ncbi:MAG: hypothetical protein N2515_05415, partial [Deltaproteobacteria bacterium]|nr:hypothetical protein [Deltaproteobacteria bacterium]